MYLVNGYDWGSIGKGSVVDLGGGEGHIAVAVAERFPSLSLIVQDLPAVIQKVEDKVPEDKVPKALASRVSFMQHDFFTEQPVKADAYLLRWILHNYPNEYCVKILRQLVPALEEGARIIVMDNIVPEPGTISQMAEREIR